MWTGLKETNIFFFFLYSLFLQVVETLVTSIMYCVFSVSFLFDLSCRSRLFHNAWQGFFILKYEILIVMTETWGTRSRILCFVF